MHCGENPKTIKLVEFKLILSIELNLLKRLSDTDNMVTAVMSV